MNRYQKPKPWRSNKHARWIAEQACPACEALDAHTLCGFQGHHENFGFAEGGMGTKYSDLHRIPLCWAHHAEREAFKGYWLHWYEQYGINPHKLVMGLINDYLVYRGVK